MIAMALLVSVLASPVTPLPVRALLQTQANRVNVLQRDAGKTVNAAVGQTVRVRLNGVGWEVSANDPTKLKPITTALFTPRRAGVGTTTKLFRAITTGDVALQFARPAADPTKPELFNVKISVK